MRKGDYLSPFVKNNKDSTHFLRNVLVNKLEQLTNEQLEQYPHYQSLLKSRRCGMISDESIIHQISYANKIKYL